MFEDKVKYSIQSQKRQYATSTYTDKKTIEFTLELATNMFTNYGSMCIVLLIQIK